MPINFAQILLDTQCVEFSVKKPFTYASGLKGPIYCDNRKLLSHVQARKEVMNGLCELVEERGLKFDHLAGLATAGIAPAAFMASVLECSMVYVRSESKKHGKQRQVEGDYSQGQKLLLIEDLVNRASSLDKVWEGVRREGLMVSDVLCIMTYQSQASQAVLKKLNLRLHSLTNLDDLITSACQLGKLDSQEKDSVLEWRNDPAKWSSLCES